MSNPKATSVRVAVAVNRLGEWSAYGFFDSDDSESAELARDLIDDSITNVHWVTATVPLPEVIEGDLSNS
jgi:hypothetical protein